MNDHELETLLSGLQPRGPSAMLSSEVEKELELDRQWMTTALPRQNRWFSPALWSSVGAAAAVLVMSIMPHPVTTAPNTVASISKPISTSPVLPISTIREVVGAQNEGIQYNTDSRLPEQHVKFVSVERHAWIDPRDGAHITVEMPREDSVVLPVSFQ